MTSDNRPIVENKGRFLGEFKEPEWKWMLLGIAILGFICFVIIPLFFTYQDNEPCLMSGGNYAYINGSYSCVK